MPVVVPVVPGLGGDLREGDHHHVGSHVGTGVHRVGDHRPAPAHDPRRELHRREDEVDHEPDEGHAVNHALACFGFTGHGTIRNLQDKTTTGMPAPSPSGNAPRHWDGDGRSARRGNSGHGNPHWDKARRCCSGR